MLRPRPPALAALVLAGALVGLAPAASAVPPFRLAEQVTDQVGALAGQEQRVTDAAAALRSGTGVQLWVVYVDSFDGSDGQTWADRTAVTSGLGADDVLLAVATGDRAYAYSVDEGFRLDDGQVQEVARDTEAELADDDWAGAAVAGAESLDEELTGTSGASSAASGSSAGLWWAVGGLALAGFVVIALVALVRRHRSRPEATGPTPEFAGTPTEALRTQADTLLVQADDAVRSAAQELQFAAAEFGTAATAEFSGVLERARAALTQAFTARQSLEDEVPETEEQRRRVLAEVIASCRSTGATLAEASEAVDALRDLVGRAPGVLDALEARLPALRARVEPAREQLSRLAGEFGEPALASVADAVAQARDRLGVAEDACARARAALADASRSGEVVDAVRVAEAATAQAEQLLAGVGRTEEDLRRAVQEVPVALARLRADARTPVEAPTGVSTAGFASAAAAALAVAEASAAQAGSDPLGALHRLVEAERALDDARGAVEAAAGARRSAEAALEQALVAARAEVAAADDFVSARRGAVGPQARTHLGEAQRHLERAVALAGADPAAALEHARQADALAERASSRAHADVSSWSSGAAGPSGDLGAVLGGILLGGGPQRSRGGFGGFGGGGFSGGFGGGFGGPGRGGYGGRPSGGGRRSPGGSGRPSGGRRGAGGRF
ncbi:TPM domain-containing protein [Kineococcus radiotolerans]|uniref:TPM domain-containing protein n=1 Tax=Kineococcus radiotolerans TaxID=131568 RepID=UPI00003A458D|nr:TPM domain-containing protein [Kineococcus radiotolerans]